MENKKQRAFGLLLFVLLIAWYKNLQLTNFGQQIWESPLNKTDDYAGAGTFRLENPSLYLNRNGLFQGECYGWCRPTVAILGIHNDRVLLVHSSKRTDENDQPGWLLPQGRVEMGRAVLAELVRGLREELTLKYSLARVGELKERGEAAVLGGYMNTYRGSDKPKYIVTVAMPVVKPSRIVVSSERNDDFRLVGNSEDLYSLLVNTRPVKQLGICSAVNRAYDMGLIGWSCKDLFARHTGELAQAA